MDLSEYHSPITSLFRDDSAKALLSEEQVEFFNGQGFLSGLEILSFAEIEALRADLSGVISGKYAEDPLFYEYNRNESDDRNRTLFHALGAWRVSPAFHDLIFHPALVKAFSQLLGGPVRFWHDQVFVKPARDGAVVAWHQDYSYWTRTKPMAHMTAWIGLDDSNEENGCVHYVLGSHRWNLLPRKCLANNMNAVFDTLTDERRQDFRPLPSILKAGQASLHHPLTLHGSFENRSERPRRAAVVNVFLDGVRSDSDEPLLAGVPAIQSGNVIDGRFFPLLGSAKILTTDALPRASHPT